MLRPLCTKVAALLLYICVPEEYETYLKTATLANNVYTVNSEGAVHRS